MLTYKKIKETEVNYAHTEVYSEGGYIGYYMKNQSGGAARVDENWNFVGATGSGYNSFYAKSQDELKNLLTNNKNQKL